MIRIEVHRVVSASDARRRVNARVPPANPAEVVPAGAVVMLDGVAIAAHVAFPGDLAAYRRTVRALPMPSTVVRSGGIRNRAQTFGFAARNGLQRRASCTSCGVSAHPAHAELCAAAAQLATQLREVVPAAATELAACMAEVHPDWKLPGGLWTSGVLNATSAMPYHFDRNNFDAWSAMSVVRSGTRGGLLHLPELGIAFECADGSVVYFNGARWLHGVTPITQHKPGAYRYSAVHYPIRNMRNCLPFAEELARARTSRVANETGLIARQRQQGLLR